MLEGPVSDLVRKDKRFGELGLKAEDYVDQKKIVALLLEHPELMQRPIVILSGNRAIIAAAAREAGRATVSGDCLARVRIACDNRSDGAADGPNHEVINPRPNCDSKSDPDRAPLEGRHRIRHSGDERRRGAEAKDRTQEGK